MKRLLILLVSTFVLFAGCSPSDSEATDRPLSVVTTVGMIADAAAEIGGNRVNAVALMGPGVDPHLYKASAGDVRRLQEADLILYNGLHLEARMGEVLEQLSGQRQVIAVGESLSETDLIGNEKFGGTHDPHIWFDVKLWMKVVDTVCQALIEADPEGRAVYEAGLSAYMGKLVELDKDIRRKLDSVEAQQRVLITAHDAFGYFGRSYDFQVRGIQGISTASEAGAKDVQNLADFIAENEIGAIFVESSVPRKGIEALQAAVRDRGFNVEIGGEMFSDAMGEEGTFEGTYIGMVTHNVDTIVKALGNKPHVR